MPASRYSERRGRSPRLDLGPTGDTSIARTVVAALLVLAGIAWLAVYVGAGGPGSDGGSLAWMSDLGSWNYVIGFGAIFVGLAIAAHRSTPLGRGRGVVIGMLGCFLIGLLWIILYYIAGSTLTLPLITDLGQYNLVVGIGFMAVGFVYATHWE